MAHVRHMLSISSFYRDSSVPSGFPPHLEPPEQLCILPSGTGLTSNARSGPDALRSAHSSLRNRPEFWWWVESPPSWSEVWSRRFPWRYCEQLLAGRVQRITLLIPRRQRRCAPAAFTAVRRRIISGSTGSKQSSTAIYPVRCIFTRVVF